MCLKGTPDKATPTSSLEQALNFVRGGLKSGAKGADGCLTPEALQSLRVRALTSAQSTGSVAEELSAALALGERVRARDVFIENADLRLNFILDCLLDENPKLVLAQDERLRMQVALYQRSGRISRILANISSGSPVALVLSALLMSVIVWAVAWCVFSIFVSLYASRVGKWFIVDQLVKSASFISPRAFIVITSAAVVGGIISIGTRLQEFSRVRDLDPFAMFWTAMLKPLIGVILSAVVLLGLSGGILGFESLKLDSAVLDPSKSESISYKALSLIWLIGFITGFSERFAWDFVDRAQNTLDPSRPKDTSVGRAGAAS